MGIRPSIYLVFGIDDYTGDMDWERLETADLSLPTGKSQPFVHNYVADMLFNSTHRERWKTGDEVVFFGGRDNGLPGVVGLIIATGNSRGDDQIVRALATIDPRFESSGKTDIQPVSPDSREYKWYVAPDMEYGDIRFQESWAYPPVLERIGMWGAYAYIARHVFERCGLDMTQLDYHRFKAMLAWTWC